MAFPCPRCKCKMCDIISTITKGYITGKSFTKRKRICRNCKKVFTTRELIEDDQSSTYNSQYEESDDYNHEVQKILDKLKGGKTSTEINQNKIATTEDLEHLEQHGLIRKEVISSGRGRPKIIWYPVEKENN